MKKVLVKISFFLSTLVTLILYDSKFKPKILSKNENAKAIKKDNLSGSLKSHTILLISGVASIMW